jgi:hypothetical protein
VHNDILKTILEKGYSEVRVFCLMNELQGNFLDDLKHMELDFYENDLRYYSDFVRLVLLYKYGGIWFDLDIFFLQCIDPILFEFNNEIILYEWEDQNYPNNALFISLVPQDEKLAAIICHLAYQKWGWGFQNFIKKVKTNTVTYSLPFDVLVLPCEWFDPGWVNNPWGITCDDFFLENSLYLDKESFFPGCVCFHWHNKWNDVIHKTSIFRQILHFIDDTKN